MYHYIILRNDLSVGQKLAQCIHAAGESSISDLPKDTRAVALQVANEKELLDLEENLKIGGIDFKAIREPDLNNQITAIGVRPCYKPHIYKYVSKLKLAM